MCNSISIIGTIFIASFLLGLIKFDSLGYKDPKDWNWQRKFAEIWNNSFNFIITGLVAYYFISFRLPLLIIGDNLTTGDFGLFIIFTLGIFGHLCVMSKNITDGIEAIIKRILDR